MNVEYSLSIYYESGIGVEKNLGVAFRLDTIASDEFILDRLFYLDVCYFNILVFLCFRSLLFSNEKWYREDLHLLFRFNYHFATTSKQRAIHRITIQSMFSLRSSHDLNTFLSMIDSFNTMVSNSLSRIDTRVLDVRYDKEFEL